MSVYLNQEELSWQVDSFDKESHDKEEALLSLAIFHPKYYDTAFITHFLLQDIPTPIEFVQSLLDLITEIDKASRQTNLMYKLILLAHREKYLDTLDTVAASEVYQKYASNPESKVVKHINFLRAYYPIREEFKLHLSENRNLEISMEEPNIPIINGRPFYFRLIGLEEFIRYNQFKDVLMNIINKYPDTLKGNLYDNDFRIDYPDPEGIHQVRYRGNLIGYIHF